MPSVRPGLSAARSARVAADDPAAAVLARLTPAQRVGQLLMVGSPATGSGSAARAARSTISLQNVGNVMLTGRSSRGTRATASVSGILRARATRHATGGVPLLVATDQEGGAVQVLSGPGFSTVPTALTQGTWTTRTLRARAAAWGRQLRAGGVTMNLAPVADTVPSAAFAPRNAPIGYFRRQFGYSSRGVGSHAIAFSQGMRDAGVVPVVKHFPGLGRVTRNTDTSAGVVDRTTSRTSAYLQPFARAAAAGGPFVMMSSATYLRIDSKHPAVFSRTTITGVLRGDLGFRGVVISDDLGRARQVARWSPGQRATMFVAAGGDVVLTVDPARAPAMQKALLAKFRSSAGFRRQVNAAALRVLRAKQAAGLL